VNTWTRFTAAAEVAGVMRCLMPSLVHFVKRRCQENKSSKVFQGRGMNPYGLGHSLQFTNVTNTSFIRCKYSVKIHHLKIT